MKFLFSQHFVYVSYYSLLEYYYYSALMQNVCSFLKMLTKKSHAPKQKLSVLLGVWAFKGAALLQM